MIPPKSSCTLGLVAEPVFEYSPRLSHVFQHQSTVLSLLHVMGFNNSELVPFGGCIGIGSNHSHLYSNFNYECCSCFQSYGPS